VKEFIQLILRLFTKGFVAGVGAVGGYYLFCEKFLGNYQVGKIVLYNSGRFGHIAISIALVAFVAALFAEAIDDLVRYYFDKST
jgi:hypothetical protein